MSFVFPEITPNFIRTIETPDYSVINGEWKSGANNNIRTGYQGVNTTLSLEFNHVTEEQFIELWNFYKTVKGSCYSFTIPDSFYKIPDSVVASILSLGSTTRWKFTQPPMFNVLVANTQRGKYNGQILLRSVTV